MTHSNVVSGGKAEIPAALKQENVRMRSLDPRHGVVAGTVIDDNDRLVCVRALL
jgi:hypothetical protein